MSNALGLGRLLDLCGGIGGIGGICGICKAGGALNERRNIGHCEVSSHEWRVTSTLSP